MGSQSVPLGLHCSSAGKEFACNAGDLGLIPVLRRSPGKGKGYPLQYSGLENSMVCMVHVVAEQGLFSSCGAGFLSVVASFVCAGTSPRVCGLQ